MMQTIQNLTSHLGSSSTSIDQKRVLKTKATHHLTKKLYVLEIHSEYTGPDEILISDGTQHPISHLSLTTFHFNGHSYCLSCILISPMSYKNFLSVSTFNQSNNVIVEIFPFYFLIDDLDTTNVLFYSALIDSSTLSCQHKLPYHHRQ